MKDLENACSSRSNFTGSILFPPSTCSCQANRRVQDVQKESSGEPVAKARKQEAPPQQALQEPSGTVCGNSQYEGDKQKGSNEAAQNENICLQDQRLSTLLDCSSLNWSSSGVPIRLLIAQIICSSLRCYWPAPATCNSPLLSINVATAGLGSRSHERPSSLLQASGLVKTTNDSSSS